MINTESWAEIPCKLGTMQWYQLSLLFPTALFLFRDLSICERTLKHETEMRLTFRETRNGARRPLQEAKATDGSGKGQCRSDAAPHRSRPHPAPEQQYFPIKGFGFTAWSTWISCANGYQGSCNPYVHFFFSWISHQLNWMSTLFLISYFKHLSTVRVISYTNEQGFPWIGFLSYHGYVTGACGYQWRHSQA